jgi:hypothetical protein
LVIGNRQTVPVDWMMAEISHNDGACEDFFVARAWMDGCG